MSEQNNKEFNYIPEEAVVSIQLTGNFVGRLQEYLTNFFPCTSLEHRNQILKDIAEGTNQEDPYVYHVKTLIALLDHIEKCAVAQNVTKKAVIDKEGNITPLETLPPDQSAK